MASSLNPFRCGGTSMPVPLLLMAKLVALCLLLTPFQPVFEGNPQLQIILRTVFLSSAVLLLFNRWVRAASFLLGLSILVGVASSRSYYGNEKTFTALLLVFAAVSGRFFEHRASAISPMRRLVLFGMWANILFQFCLMIFTGVMFTMFFYSMNAAMLAFAPWPQSRVTVIWDGDCGFCGRCKAWIERFDLEGLFDWHAFQSGIGERIGISTEVLTARLHLVAEGRIYSGFRAVRYIFFTSPLVWFLIAALLSVVPESWSNWRRAVVVCALLFFSPVFAPIGEKLYDMVARNRHRLAPNGVCKV